MATKIELNAAGIEFTEVKAADPAAADLVARFADANGGASGMTAPLVLVSDDSGNVIDSWAGRPGAVVDRITSIAA
ncbi:hypothetical protein [Gordonia sputi]|uniref:hypothetical protein n=1 Tax=Gordonia sputi TaxID=36823 RepID=UPI00226ED5F0|nr:hypothetical protein [Gordonia sputi]